MKPELVTLPFDHYQRYGAAAALVAGIGGDNVKDVLEVGANRQRILKSFMPGSRFVFSDLEPQEPIDDGDDIFVQADATQLPFEDRQFDAVISLDVMEHIPPHLRAIATQQMARVAQRIVVIGCPLDFEWVHDAEKKANAVWENYFGAPYPWLKEHEEFGLVDPDVVTAALVEAGLHVMRFGQGDVDVWAGMMASHFLKEVVPELAAVVSAADRLYNETVFAGDRGERAYREFFVAVRDADDYARLKASSFLNATPSLPATHLLSRLAERLEPVVQRVRKAEGEWAATADVARRLEGALVDANATHLQVEFKLRSALEAHAELRIANAELNGANAELRSILVTNDDAARRAEAKSLELAETLGSLNVRLETANRDFADASMHRGVLAVRVAVLERRQYIAKWSAFIAIAACVGAFAVYRMMG
jgi:hypothetical protein